ncbi:MAG TPA: hypothetical protein DGC94_21830 [Prolixibacteraceae bacterium]|nr:MAG: hypothetical protein A2W92_15750 [Bacteroidetes bacterium GWA2_42_15]HCU63756.1 hypothetical protein [Prolixibacteraceae bacterium]
MFDCYIKMQQLPDEVKRANKIKVEAIVPRLDCVSMAGYYEGLKPLFSSKGQLKFYLMETRGLINSSDQRRAGYFLMGEDSINFSSIFLQDFDTDKQAQCFGYGEPNSNKTLKSGQPNPMLPFSEDAYLFITNPGFTEFEILIIRRGRYLIQGYLKQLANGTFNEALAAMRSQAKPIFNY